MIEIPNIIPPEEKILIDVAKVGKFTSKHAATHENGGSDEIDVTSLSGLLADPQTPLSHHNSHITNGSDEIPEFTSSSSGLVPRSSGGDKKFLREDGTWAREHEELFSSEFTSDEIPFNKVLIRNKYGDNTLDTSMVDTFTFTSVSGTSPNYTVVVSDLPPGIDLMNSSSGYPWFIIILDSFNVSTDPGFTGDYTSFLRIDAVTGNTLTCTFFGSGSAPSVGQHFVYYNPWEDGFIRNPSNPVLTVSDFPSLGNLYVSQAGRFRRQNGEFVLFVGVKDASSSIKLGYATTTDFINWTPHDVELFTSRPSWAADYFFPEGEGEYLPDEQMYFFWGKGRFGSSTQGVGWIKVSEDLSTYEISPEPIISLDEINYFLPDYLDVNSYRNAYDNVIKKNDEYIMISLLYTKFVGTHTGSSGTTVLEDSNAHFEADTLAMLEGTPIKNITAGINGTISANTETTVNTSITWSSGDSYEIDDVITRRIIVCVSSSRYGPFRIVSMVPMRDYSGNGSAGSRWLEPNDAFVYKGNIYFVVGASSKYIQSGTRGNRVTSFFKLDEATYNLINIPNNPIFTGLLYADKFGYTDVTWESDHLGFASFIVDETTNKLWVIYDGTYGTDNYKIGVASKSLDLVK